MDTKKIIGSTILAAAIAGGGFAAGVVGMTGISGAQDSTTTAPSAAAPATPDSSSAPGTGAATPTTPAGPGAGRAAHGAGGAGVGANHDPKVGGHVGANGTTETLLTGDAAVKVTAAAQAAVTDATVDRVETDAEGAAYEAHMTKADGSEITVKLDTAFAVTGTEAGPGGPGGPGGPR